MDTNSKACHKDSGLLPIMKEHLGKKMNLARIKLITLLLTSLCKVQTVNLQKLATAFETTAESLSSMRRIQRFLACYPLDFDLLARIVFRLLPHPGPYVLSMDRTNWRFGCFDINALVLGITYRGVAFPLLFRLLPKRGNSNTAERKEIILRYIRLFGRETIDCLVADREFVGEEWLSFLNTERIRYHLRIRENFWVKDPRTGREFKAWWMFNRLKQGQYQALYRIYYVNNQLCYLSAARMKNRDGKPEYRLLYLSTDRRNPWSNTGNGGRLKHVSRL